MRVVVLGPEGTYGEEAGRRYAPGAQLIYGASHAQVVDIVSRGEADEGVVAIENLLDGTVVETLDLLQQADVFVREEIVIPVRHCLAAVQGAGRVARILSHPKALAQCRDHLLRHYPDALLLERASTASALAEIAQAGAGDAAAIASPAGAAHYGLAVLAQGIDDRHDNATRFFVVSRELRRDGDKTAALFACAHKPGALWESIGCFARNGVNLTKIESRPIRGRSWEYLFFVDFEGGMQEERVQRALRDLQEHTSMIKILGSYRRDRNGDR